MVYAFAAFVVLAFLAGTTFRAPMLVALAIVSLFGSLVALLVAGHGIVGAIGWAVAITLAVEASFIAGLAVTFLIDEALIRTGRKPLRRRPREPIGLDLTPRAGDR